jgi:signal transduction histidine kinase
MIEPLARERQLHFNLTVPEMLGIIQSDPRKLRQILLNLAANAVKFTTRGTIEIRVDRQDGAIRFEVRDSGIGIRADDLHRIFDPFWQVSPAKKTERPDGTGLGLTIVHRFVTQLGGRIDVESELGQGTVFRILIPVGARSALALDGPLLASGP